MALLRSSAGIIYLFGAPARASYIIELRLLAITTQYSITSSPKSSYQNLLIIRSLNLLYIQCNCVFLIFDLP